MLPELPEWIEYRENIIYKTHDLSFNGSIEKFNEFISQTTPMGERGIKSERFTMLFSRDTDEVSFPYDGKKVTYRKFPSTMTTNEDFTKTRINTRYRRTT
jgi:hypothetical protein